MYLLFKAQHGSNMGIVQTIGRVLDYTVGFIPDTHTDLAKIEHLNATVLEEDVARGWLFFAAWRDHISVKAGTPQDKILGNICSSTENDSYKAQYVLTDDDNTAAVKFTKALLRMILDEVYDKRFEQNNNIVSTLEYTTWATQEKEARSYLDDNTVSTPMLDALATARGITTAEMAQRVVDKIDAYNADITERLASKNEIEQEIKACQTRQEIIALMHNRFGINGHPDIDGIDGDAIYNL